MCMTGTAMCGGRERIDGAVLAPASPTLRHAAAFGDTLANRRRTSWQPIAPRVRALAEPVNASPLCPLYSASRNSLVKTRTTGTREVCQHSGL
jgi:hypothetical protein